jgi:hypothetical protein
MVESVLWLHKATNDDSWLDAGEEILQALEDLQRACGVAAIKDVRQPPLIVFGAVHCSEPRDSPGCCSLALALARALESM